MAREAALEDAITRFLLSRQNVNPSTMMDRHNWTDSKAKERHQLTHRFRMHSHYQMERKLMSRNLMTALTRSVQLTINGYKTYLGAVTDRNENRSLMRSTPIRGLIRILGLPIISLTVVRRTATNDVLIKHQSQTAEIPCKTGITLTSSLTLITTNQANTGRAISEAIGIQDPRSLHDLARTVFPPTKDCSCQTQNQ